MTHNKLNAVNVLILKYSF